MDVVMVEADLANLSPTPDEMLRDYASGIEVDDDAIHQMVDAGYITNEIGALTPAGIEKAKELGVEMTEVVILTLGIPISAYTTGHEMKNIRAGSELQVLFAGRDRRKLHYFDCAAGVAFPILRIYANKLHTFRTETWPTHLPMRGSYLTAP